MATTTTIIDPASAKGLIAEYQQNNENAGEKTILTPDGVPLNGFFLDRKSLESLLSDPDVEGVSLHLAKHPDFSGSEKHHFTALYTGAVPDTAENATTPFVSKGLIFNTMPPCPPSCVKIAGA
jgi:hypothetical protein